MKESHFKLIASKLGLSEEMKICCKDYLVYGVAFKKVLNTYKVKAYELEECISRVVEAYNDIVLMYGDLKGIEY